MPDLRELETYLTPSALSLRYHGVNRQPLLTHLGSYDLII